MQVLTKAVYVLREIALRRDNAHIAFLALEAYREQYYTLGAEYERYKRYYESFPRNERLYNTKDCRIIELCYKIGKHKIPYYFFYALTHDVIHKRYYIFFTSVRRSLCLSRTRSLCLSRKRKRDVNNVTDALNW